MSEDFHIYCGVLYSGLDPVARTKSSVVTSDPLILTAIRRCAIDVDALTTRGNDLVRYVTEHFFIIKLMMVLGR